MSDEMPGEKCKHGYYIDIVSPCPYCLMEKDKKMKELEEENVKLKAIIKDLHEKVDAKNRVINRLQHDSWDDVTYDREDR